MLTCYPEFSRVIRRVEEISILIIPHGIMDSPHSFHIKTQLTRLPKPFVSSKGLDAIHIGELDRRGFTYVCFYKGHVECYHRAD